MPFEILQPHTLADRHAGHTLSREGLMVEIAGIGFVGTDLCRTPEARGHLLAMRYSGKVLRRESALWVHTGVPSPAFAAEIDVAKSDKRRGVVVIGGQAVTTLERTAIELLIASPETGIGYMCELIRAGTTVAKIEAYARRLSLAGIIQTREILHQLPRDLGVISQAPSP